MVHLFLKLCNVIVYILFTGGNIFSTIASGKLGTLELHNPNYLTPAPWASLIWALIHLLLGGFVIFQFFESAHDHVVHGVGYQFVFAQLLHFFWLTFWNSGWYFFAWIEILFVASTISYIYYNLRNYYPAETTAQKLFIQAPFSLYHAWVVVVVVINTFAAFTGFSTPGTPSLLQTVLAISGLIFLTTTAIGYIEYKGDILGGLVIAWSLLAISANQPSQAIHWTSFAFSVIVFFYSFKNVLLKRTEEQTPLLPS